MPKSINNNGASKTESKLAKKAVKKQAKRLNKIGQTGAYIPASNSEIKAAISSGVAKEVIEPLTVKEAWNRIDKESQRNLILFTGYRTYCSTRNAAMLAKDKHPEHVFLWMLNYCFNPAVGVQGLFKSVKAKIQSRR